MKPLIDKKIAIELDKYAIHNNFVTERQLIDSAGKLLAQYKL